MILPYGIKKRKAIMAGKRLYGRRSVNKRTVDWGRVSLPSSRWAARSSQGHHGDNGDYPPQKITKVPKARRSSRHDKPQAR
jgi:hypothetical protein